MTLKELETLLQQMRTAGAKNTTVVAFHVNVTGSTYFATPTEVVEQDDLPHEFVLSLRRL